MTILTPSTATLIVEARDAQLLRVLVAMGAKYLGGEPHPASVARLIAEVEEFASVSAEPKSAEQAERGVSVPGIATEEPAPKMGVHEVAQRTGLGERRIRQLAHRLGGKQDAAGRWRFTVEDVDGFLEGRSQ